MILGGSGFIGSHLGRLLSQMGHYVRVVDIKPPLCPADDYIAMALKDIPLHPSVLDNIEVVYHLAWNSLPKTSNINPSADIDDNLIGSVGLLEQCVINQGVKKVIFISSGGTVYGIPRQVPILEDHPKQPLCSYGITKLGFENYLEMFRVNWGQEYVVIRGSNPYGEGQDFNRPQGVVSVFLHRLMQDKPIEIWGDGRVIRDYIYVRDLALALYRCLDYDQPKNGWRIFNVGSGSGLSLLDIIQEMEKLTGKRARLEFKPSRTLDVPINVLDCQRIESLLNWRPIVSFPEGLRRTWESLKNMTVPEVSG